MVGNCVVFTEGKNEASGVKYVLEVATQMVFAFGKWQGGGVLFAGWQTALRSKPSGAHTEQTGLQVKISN